jgi:uncharacterized membrane protein
MPDVSPLFRFPLFTPPLISVPVFLLALFVSVVTVAFAELSAAVPPVPLLLQLQSQRVSPLKKSNRLMVSSFKQLFVTEELLQVFSQPVKLSKR